MRTDTRSVTINRPPEEVYALIADVTNWPLFSPFANRVENRGDHWIVTSDQGDVKVETLFDPDTLCLDHRVTLPSGESVVIPYGVVPDGNGGAVLTMTNVQAPGDSDAAYAEQLAWTEKELANAKKLLEEDYH